MLVNRASVQVQVKELFQASLPSPPPVVVDCDRVAGVCDLVVRVARVLVLIVVRVLQRLCGRLAVRYLRVVRVCRVDRYVRERGRLRSCVHEDWPSEEEQPGPKT